MFKPIADLNIFASVDTSETAQELLREVEGREVEIRFIEIAKIEAGQDIWFEEKLERLARVECSELPLVAAIGERLVMIDGHHRTIFAALRGEQGILVRIMR